MAFQGGSVFCTICLLFLGAHALQLPEPSLPLLSQISETADVTASESTDQTMDTERPSSRGSQPVKGASLHQHAHTAKAARAPVVQLIVRSPALVHRHLSVTVPKTVKMQAVMKQLAAHMGLKQETVRLMFNAKQIQPEDTPSSLRLANHDVIQMASPAAALQRKAHSKAASPTHPVHQVATQKTAHRMAHSKVASATHSASKLRTAKASASVHSNIKLVLSNPALPHGSITVNMPKTSSMEALANKISKAFGLKLTTFRILHKFKPVGPKDTPLSLALGERDVLRLATLTPVKALKLVK